jgi:hypothetical protein
MTEGNNMYIFTIKLSGSVEAASYAEAEAKISAHVDELGKVNSEKYDLGWPDVSWEIEEE